MSNPYHEAFSFTDRAPRLQEGWSALLDLLSEGIQTRERCISTITATGLAPGTAQNMLAEAVSAGHIRSHSESYGLV